MNQYQQYSASKKQPIGTNQKPISQFKFDNNHNLSSSRQRLLHLQKQQQHISEIFKIDNFYQERRFDICTLKAKINEFKSHKKGINQFDAKIAQQQHIQKQNKMNQKKVLIPLSKKLITSRNFYPSIIEQQQTYNGTMAKLDDLKANNRNIEMKNSHRQSHNLTGPKKSVYLSRQKNNNSVFETADRYKNVNNSNLQDYSTLTQQKKAVTPFLQSYDTDANGDSIHGNRHHKTKSTMIPKIHNIGHRHKHSVYSPKNINGYLNNQLYASTTLPKSSTLASRLQPIKKKPIVKIQINEPEQLQQFEKNIWNVWELYEKLSQITNTISSYKDIQMLEYENDKKFRTSRTKSGQNSVISNKQTYLTSQEFIGLLTSYKQTVCSRQLQFLINILQNCMSSQHAKIVVQSRLLQNLSVIYIFLQIAELTISPCSYNQNIINRNINLSHLVNFVGLCSNSLLLVLRVLTLTFNVNHVLALSQQLEQLYSIIRKYQLQSFRQQLLSLKDVIIRIQHNNQLVSIIQSKLNYKLKDKEVHIKSIGSFMRGVFNDRLRGQYRGLNINDQNEQRNGYKPFFQYSYFIFQYLAYYLHNQEYYGIFPQSIETAPEPYLPLSKEFTAILDPMKIFINVNNNKVYIRAHTQKFLKELAQKFNIIFWSDQMPHQIDAYFDLLNPQISTKKQAAINQSPKKQIQIKRLYRHHCLYDTKDNFSNKYQLTMIKDISRIGCEPNKYIIFDGDSDNFYEDDERFIVKLPWNGQAEDSRLLLVLDLLLPLLREGTDLSKCLQLLYPRMNQLLKQKQKTYLRNKRRK